MRTFLTFSILCIIIAGIAACGVRLDGLAVSQAPSGAEPAATSAGGAALAAIGLWAVWAGGIAIIAAGILFALGRAFPAIAGFASLSGELVIAGIAAVAGGLALGWLGVHAWARWVLVLGALACWAVYRRKALFGFARRLYARTDARTQKTVSQQRKTKT